MNRKFSEQELIRRESLKKLQEANLNPYEVEKVDRSCTLKEFIDKYSPYSKEELAEKFHDKELTVAGRVMNIRQTFSHIKDFSGKLQLYVNKKEDPIIWNIQSSRYWRYRWSKRIPNENYDWRNFFTCNLYENYL